MTLEEIRKIDIDKCENFADFARNNLPMIGDKKHLDEILNVEICITDFRLMESKHRQNSQCLQIQFIMNGMVYVAFTGSSVLINQIQSFRDKIPFRTSVVKIDKYYSLS